MQATMLDCAHSAGIPRKKHALAQVILKDHIDQYKFDAALISTDVTPNVLPRLDFDKFHKLH